MCVISADMHCRLIPVRVRRTAKRLHHLQRAIGKRLIACEGAIERMRGSRRDLRAGWEFARCFGTSSGGEMTQKSASSQDTASSSSSLENQVL